MHLQSGVVFSPSTSLYTDIVSSVTIIPPALAEESDSVPAGVELLFGASLVTVYGTSITGQITYSWQFGDGTVILTQDPSVSHTYQSSGMYNVSLSVITFSQNLTESYHLNVYMSKVYQCKIRIILSLLVIVSFHSKILFRCYSCSDCE